MPWYFGSQLGALSRRREVREAKSASVANGEGVIAIMVNSEAKDGSRCLMGEWSSHSIRNVTLALFFMLMPSISSLSSEEWSKGQSVFNSNCAICHGRDGRGGRGPNLLGSLQNGNLDSDVETIIRHGLPG